MNSIDDLPVLRQGPGARRSDPGSGLLNSKPLKAADLNGKVVVYDFWTYSCVNCVRTLPYLEAWHERYAKDGLVHRRCALTRVRVREEPHATSPPPSRNSA